MVKINFWKMHGLENDYIVFGDWKKEIKEDYPILAKKLCKRRSSIGADGIVILCQPSDPQADLRMRMFNPDGSEAEMCGNGIRCLAKYAYETSIIPKIKMKIETLSGLKTAKLEFNKETISNIIIDMGIPNFRRKHIPMIGKGEFINKPLYVNNTKFDASCLSIGNPHCVIIVNDVNNTPVEIFGPLLEKHSYFPKRVNVEFAQVLDRKNMKIRVWERGCGETFACGTGACASAVIAHKINLVDDEVIIHLKGGDLQISISNRIYMKGPAIKVFEGFILT